MSKKKMTWLSTSVLLVVVLVLVPWMRDTETRVLTAPNVETFPGNYVQLSKGHVRYRLDGPADGELVLLVGGLTTSMEFFDATAEFLNEAGYQTLQYDLYGRGGSARPSGERYDKQTFISQIDGLLAELNIESSVHIVGQSLGGGISAAWVAENSGRTRSLSIHASAGYVKQLPPGADFLSMPVVGPYLWWWTGNGFVTGNIPRYFAQPEKQIAEIASLEAQFAAAGTFHGYRHAVLSTLVNFGAEDMQDVFSRISATDTPVQIIWGSEDVVIPVDASEVLTGWIDGTPKVVVIEGVGHMPLLEDPLRVQTLVLDHLKAS